MYIGNAHIPFHIDQGERIREVIVYGRQRFTIPVQEKLIVSFISNENYTSIVEANG